MFGKFLLTFVLSLCLVQVTAEGNMTADTAVFIIPAPQIDVQYYQGLQQLLRLQFGERAVVSTLKIPLSFNYDYNPEKEIKAALIDTQITSPRKRVLLVGHSWGGHAIQNFLKQNKNESYQDWHIMGGVLLGSSIQRNFVSIQKDGTSYIDMGADYTPIMIFGGDMDGLNRISRFAESFYHTHSNVDPRQKNKFYNIIMEGMNHASFANLSMEQPVYIKKNDLKTEISPWDKLGQIAQLIGIRFKQENPGLLNKMLNDTQTFMEPFVEAMEMEGYYQLKKPCYGSDMINPDVPTCTQGSPFVSQIAHNMMASSNTFKNRNVTMVNSDQFHRASTVIPVHHPVIEGSCSLDSTTPCEFKTYTITENSYSSKNDFTLLDRFQVAAWDMRVKMKSRQALRIASGEKDADFHKYDEVGNRCGEINQWVIDWAYKSSRIPTQERYDKQGQKLVVTDDRNTINGGLWIYAWMTYTESKDKKQMEASSYAYRMNDKFPVKAFAGDHYCKLLSPFKALEWIYVDSMYQNNSFEFQASTDETSFLQ